jgi:hypothetical protein
VPIYPNFHQDSEARRNRGVFNSSAPGAVTTSQSTGRVTASSCQIIYRLVFDHLTQQGKVTLLSFGVVERLIATNHNRDGRKLRPNTNQSKFGVLGGPECRYAGLSARHSSLLACVHRSTRHHCQRVTATLQTACSRQKGRQFRMGALSSHSQCNESIRYRRSNQSQRLIQHVLHVLEHVHLDTKFLSSQQNWPEGLWNDRSRTKLSQCKKK